jgi:hypothetical protein
MRQEYGLNATWLDITPPFTSSGPIETLTSNSLRPNMLFRFQVLATNSYGSSRYVTSNIIFTTPATPGNVQAVRQPNGTVTLTWTITHPPTNQGQASTRYTQRIERSPDGTVWSVVNPQFIPSAGGTQTWTDASPSRGAMRYRVITITPEFPGGPLESAPGVSNNLEANYKIFGGSQKAVHIYAGDLFATKIYMGAVQVWADVKPLRPADYRAEWYTRTDGATELRVIDPHREPPSGTYDIQVDPVTTPPPHGDWILGRLSPTSTHSFVQWGPASGPTSPPTVQFSDDRLITVAQAQSAWAGHRIRATLDWGAKRITSLEVVV